MSQMPLPENGKLGCANRKVIHLAPGSKFRSNQTALFIDEQLSIAKNAVCPIFVDIFMQSSPTVYARTILRFFAFRSQI
jgi:hypothetical protein